MSERRKECLLLEVFPIHVSYFAQFFYLCPCGPGTGRPANLLANEGDQAPSEHQERKVSVCF